jgi:DNA modification methylase
MTGKINQKEEVGNMASGGNYQLIKGDCLEVIQTLPENSIDCVISSPPYW